MISNREYHYSGHRRTWRKAKKYKDELRYSGWRVKITKAAGGGYDIYRKHIAVIDHQNHMKGRRRGLVIAWGGWTA